MPSRSEGWGGLFRVRAKRTPYRCPREARTFYNPMAYSEKLLDYFQNPRCVGEIPDAHAVVEVSNPVCGDVMKLWVKLDNGRIQDARFKAQGCSAAIATS